MTHTQLIYLLIILAAFLIFTGSLLKATITSLSAGGDSSDAQGKGPTAPRR